ELGGPQLRAARPPGGRGPGWCGVELVGPPGARSLAALAHARAPAPGGRRARHRRGRTAAPDCNPCHSTFRGRWETIGGLAAAAGSATLRAPARSRPARATARISTASLARLMHLATLFLAAFLLATPLSAVAQAP